VTTRTNHREDSIWQCVRCGLSLEMRKVGISYLGNTFPVTCFNVPDATRCMSRKTWRWKDGRCRKTP